MARPKIDRSFVLRNFTCQECGRTFSKNQMKSSNIVIETCDDCIDKYDRANGEGLYRMFTDASDLLIVTDDNKGRDFTYMAKMYQRDVDMIRERIAYLKETGAYDTIIEATKDSVIK